VASGKEAAEQVGTALARAKLPSYARRLFDRLGGAHDAELQGSNEQLLAVLKKHEHPAHEAVLRFDEAFGGLLLRGEASPSWREDGMFAVVGAHACLASQGERFRQKGLVPVLYDSHSGVEFLDAQGRAFIIDEIEEVLTPFAPDGATMLAAIIAFDLLEGRGEVWKGFARRPGEVGESVAHALGLIRVPLDCPAKLWVSGDAVLSEAGEARMAAFTDDAWRQMQAALVAT
jgi:hypothetical protein